MKYRYATIHAAESLDAAGTKTIPINVTEPISRIDIRFEVTASGYTMAKHPAADITKIELVDGSDVLHSMDGYENQALCIYDRRVPTMCHGQHYNGNAECTLYGIDFGRYLWDPVLAFLPTRFKNPQLKITHTLTSVYSAASAGELEVFAHVFDEKVISPVGFLMSKEIYDASSPANDAFHYIDLPIDYPLRKLLLRAYADGYSPWRQIEGFRLDENNQKRIPIDVNTEDYYRMMKGVWPMVHEPVIGYTDGSEVLYVTPTDYYAILTGIPIGGTNEPLKLTTWMPGGKFTIESAAACSIMGMAHGWLPNHCFEFPFGNQDDPDDWYDVSKLGSLRARIRGGATGTSGTAQLVTQQLRRY